MMIGGLNTILSLKNTMKIPAGCVNWLKHLNAA